MFDYIWFISIYGLYLYMVYIYIWFISIYGLYLYMVYIYIWFISITHLAISPSGENLWLDGCWGNEGRDAVIVFVIEVGGGGV